MSKVVLSPLMRRMLKDDNARRHLRDAFSGRRRIVRFEGKAYEVVMAAWETGGALVSNLHPEVYIVLPCALTVRPLPSPNRMNQYDDA